MTTFDVPSKTPFENNVGKEKMPENQHFLLFSRCFPSYETQLKCLGDVFNFSSAMTTFDAPRKNNYEIIMG